MKKLIEGFADQLRLAIEIGLKSSFKNDNAEIRNIVIMGMGGSGTGADIVAGLNKDNLKIPLEVVKSYTLPKYVDKYTLFIASSYSGNTEETCICLKNAIDKGANICIISGGGEIKRIAEEQNLNCISIPGDANCPRASVGLSFVSLLFVLYKYELIADGFIDEIESAAKLLEREQADIILKSQKIAKILKSKSPIIYSDDTFQPIALRFQQQINENSKQLAHINVFPEMNHNELVGWSAPVDMFSNRCLIYVQNHTAHDSIKKRMEICREIFKEKCENIIDIESKGSSLLEGYVYLIHFADWISYYLALENDVDPFPVEKIDYLKSRLVETVKKA